MQNKNWLNNLGEAITTGSPLIPVTHYVDIGKGKPPEKEKVFPCVLRPDASFLNRQKEEGIERQLNADQAKLHALGLTGDDFTAFFFAQKYGWRVAAASKGISFFDDLRIEEALAACDGAEEYLLIKGDLTGIQEFIEADINLDLAGGARKVAKRLRGKSFFVSVVTDFLAENLLKQLDLPIWNLLFAGGGHFNILAPNSPKVVSALQAWEKSTQLHLISQIGGSLGLVIAQQICGKDLVSKADTYFELLNRNRDQKKYRKANHYISALFNAGGGAGRLGINEFEKLGGGVPKSDYLIQVQKRSALQIKENDVISVFSTPDGMELFLVSDEKKATAFIDQYESDLADIKVVRINDTDFLPVQTDIKGRAAYGFRLIGNEAPKNKEGEIKDFEEICTRLAPKGELMYEMMAVMRLDVDDLGCIFSHGLSSAGLKEVTALSREMNFFFAGYFNCLAKQHHIYVVYSGGDDAFVVGHWYDILHFSSELKQAFDQFTGNNPNLNFSAGIFTCDAHYPVAKFADDAKLLLDGDAKKYKEKNRLSVFNHRISWAHFSDMLEFGNKVLSYTVVDDNKKSVRLTKSLVYRILSIVKSSFYEKTEYDENNQLVRRGHLKPEVFYRNLANLKYVFARQGFNDKKLQDAEEKSGSLEGDVIKFIVNAFDESRDNDAKRIITNNLKVALNYALYQLREPSK